MTEAQREALKWLRDRNGDGVFDRFHVLIAAGERAPFMRSTWNDLERLGHVEFYAKKRVRITGQ